MNYDRTNTGALFKNDKQGNDKRPDYRGKLNVGGVDYEVAAWLKSSKAGTKYLSLSVQLPRERVVPESQAVAAPQSAPAFDDDLPF